jgi:hypothetical protein
MTRNFASRACAARMHKFIIRLIKIDQLIGEPDSRLREGDFIGIWRCLRMSIEDELKISLLPDNVAIGHKSCSLFRIVILECISEADIERSSEGATYKLAGRSFGATNNLLDFCYGRGVPDWASKKTS